MRRAVLLATLLVAFAAGCRAAEQPIVSGEPEPTSATGPQRQKAVEATAEQVQVAAALGGLGNATSAAQAVEDTCRVGEERPARTPDQALAAVAKRSLVAYSSPGGEELQSFETRNVNDVPTVFGVLAVIVDERCDPAWYRVQLPIWPNGATGYVRAADVGIGTVRTRIEIDLSERQLDFYQDGERLLRATVAIGKPRTPTPTGSYYVNQRLVPLDTEGPFGPAAIGISGFSPVLRNWAQGGPIAIHGTDDPGSIGEPASHGCLRLENTLVQWLFDRTLAGTPVEITA